MNAVVGFCRFSFLGPGDWMRYRDPEGDMPPVDLLAAAGKELYNPARLAKRFRTFEQITLPSVAGQTEKDFIFHVITSTALPDPWLSRLRQLCEGVETIRLTVADSVVLSDVTQPILDDLQSRHDNVLQFRLDDDDAIAGHYVQLLHEHGRRMEGIPTFGMTFTEGLMAGTYPDEPLWHAKYSRPFQSCASIMKFETSHKCIVDVPHFSIRHRFTHFTDRTNMGAFMLKWPSDSRRIPKDQVPDYLERVDRPRFRRICRRHFPHLEEVDFESLSGDAPQP